MSVSAQPECQPEHFKMPIVVSATGEAGLPSTQAEIDARRAARLAKQASGIKKRPTQKKKPRESVTDGMSCNLDKLESGVKRELIRFVYTPDPELPGVPDGLRVVLPGPNGHDRYILNIKDRLKEAGYRFNPKLKLWWDVPPDDAAQPGDGWPTPFWY